MVSSPNVGSEAGAITRAPAFLSAAWRMAVRRPSRPAAPLDAAPALSAPSSLEARLAATRKEVRRAQRLRYKVFYEERGWPASPVARLSRRDRDGFDPICDHLLVLDHAERGKPWQASRPKVVGTYRLLRREVAERRGGFYSAAEFDLDPLLAVSPDLRVLELGRSCVHRAYRSRKVVDLLWGGVRAYAARHEIDVLIGCASLPGTDLGALATPLSYLHHYAPAAEGWRVRARPDRRVPMDLVPIGQLDRRAAFRTLPPLLKGYLRAGATIGDGAVVDHEFGTTDVFVIMPVGAIRHDYQSHFGSPSRLS